MAGMRFNASRPNTSPPIDCLLHQLTLIVAKRSEGIGTPGIATSACSHGARLTGSRRRLARVGVRNHVHVTE